MGPIMTSISTCARRSVDFKFTQKISLAAGDGEARHSNARSFFSASTTMTRILQREHQHLCRGM